MRLVIGFSVLVLIIGSFYIGTRVGSTTHQYADAQFKAAILVKELESIRNGTCEKWIPTKEIELNGLIAFHQRWEDGLYKYIWPETWDLGHSGIRQAAKYRKEYPFKIQASDPEQQNEWESSVQEVIKTYGK